MRARDLGLPFPGTPGPLNAITDVAGVSVGTKTLLDPARHRGLRRSLEQRLQGTWLHQGRQRLHRGRVQPRHEHERVDAAGEHDAARRRRHAPGRARRSGRLGRA